MPEQIHATFSERIHLGSLKGKPDETSKQWRQDTVKPTGDCSRDKACPCNANTLDRLSIPTETVFWPNTLTYSFNFFHFWHRKLVQDVPGLPWISFPRNNKKKHETKHLDSTQVTNKMFKGNQGGYRNVGLSKLRFWTTAVSGFVQWKYFQNPWSEADKLLYQFGCKVECFINLFLFGVKKIWIWGFGFLMIFWLSNNLDDIKPYGSATPRCNCCMAWYLALVSWRVFWT